MSEGTSSVTKLSGWTRRVLACESSETVQGRRGILKLLLTAAAAGVATDAGALPSSRGQEPRLIGHYTQGNEPAFHISYLYCDVGAPRKTQKFVRQIMRTWYQDQPLGLPADDDNGATISWFVLSATGFYPVCPGRPYYIIGSPIFAECEIDVEEGKTFRHVARDVSALNKYIQSASLNGEPLNKPWFSHSALMNGGTLTLQIGPEPPITWGSQPDAAPPRGRHCERVV